MITIPGYHTTDLVYRSDTSDVYRGYRDNDLQPLFFKVLRHDYPLFMDLAQYRREYELLSSVDLEGVIRAYSLEKYHHTLVIILEDFGGLSLDHLVRQGPLPLNDFLTLAIEITRALASIHRQHIIHKDVNPSNIVWNPQTRQLKFIDFGVSTSLSRENPILKNANLIEGTLTYISPEQTGRMNRSIDYRSDYYSLGITFYELLTGQLPFYADDAMGLIHAHIANVALSPTVLLPHIPPVVSDIVMKLMSKTPEKRYQSTEALLADLEECLKRLRETGSINAFSLAQNDMSDQFYIPETLYGRQDNIIHLLTIFQQVAKGETGVVLYTGEPGSGKSALVREIHKPIVAKQGYFIAGKFDQFKRHIPYTAIVYAFDQLVHQILTEREAHLEQWRAAILQAVGVSGQVLIDIIPSLELIIGPQPEIAALPAAEAQNRFQYVFQNFVRAISPKAHPLVLFIDDLQWADAASLNLLKRLCSEAETPYFLLMGAYRDSEVDESHPLMLMIEQLQQANVAVHHVHLQNLTLDHVNELTADTLHCDLSQARALAEVVYEKTGGNAFFVTQFLKELHQEDLLTFNAAQRRWEWDSGQIQNRSVTDNVVELMSQKLRRLPAKTQSTLALAACIGNVFDLGTLALVSKSSITETFSHLWHGLVEDLVLPLDDTYRVISVLDNDEQAAASLFKFLHDRVQQAAYALIPVNEQSSVHLEIGRQLLVSLSEHESGEVIFNIVNHLNRGIPLITDVAERTRIAALNLQAGTKAKFSTAYDTALRYFITGMGLLPEDSWETAYDLTFALSIARAECEYLLSHFEAADDLFNRLLLRVHTPLEAAKTLNLMAILNTSRGNITQTLQSGQRGLAVLSFHLPDSADEKKKEVGQELGAIQSSLSRLDSEDLLRLPDLTDPDRAVILDLCLNMIPMAIMSGDLDLYALLALKMVNMSLTHGSAAPSSHAFIIYAAILVNAMNDYKTAYRFGRLGLALGEKYKNASIEAKNNMVFACWINVWSQHLETNLPYLMKAYEKGLEAGDFFFATSGLFNYVVVSIHLGRNFDEVNREALRALAFCTKSKDEITTSIMTCYTHLIANLRGESKNKFTLDTDTFDMDAHLQSVRETKNAIHLCHCLQCKLEPLYLFGNLKEALKTTSELETVIDSLRGTMFQIRFQFFHALVLSASYKEMPNEDKVRALETLSDYQQQARVWTEQCPENFALVYALMSGEIARIQGHDLEAMMLYEDAVRCAHEYDYPQYEAMAHELSAKFYQARGQARIAAMYMSEAHYIYQLCGMTGKVRDLEDTYPQWFGKNSFKDHRHTVPTTQSLANAALDLNAILKASQAISSEINFDRLMARLIHIAVETVGAESGSLILEYDGTLFVEVFGSVETPDVTIKYSIPLEHVDNVAVAIVHYVARTKTSLVLGHAAEDPRFTSDPYIQTHKPKSVLCTPIVQSGTLTGVLYLENSLATDAFAANQLEILNLLNAQMAISIENARLYRDVEVQSNVIRATNVELQREVIERQKAENMYRSIFENATDGIFQSTVEGRFITANPACARILGYDSPDELVRSVNHIGSQLYLNPPLREEIITHIQDGIPIPGYETQLYRRDGSVIWAAIRARPIYDASGAIQFFEGSLQDVTERVRAEMALRQEEERFRYVALATRDGIYDWDIRADLITHNEAYRALYSPGEAINPSGLWWEENIHPEDRPQVMESLKKTFEVQGHLWLGQYRLRRLNGSYATVIDRGYILYDKGEPSRMIGAVTDISSQKQMEKALEDERNLLRTLIDKLPHFIYYKDAQGDFVIKNAASERMFDLNPTYNPGSSTDNSSYVSELTAQYHAEDLAVLQSGQERLDQEEIVIDVEGNALCLLTSRLPIRARDGQIMGVVGIGIDITERKHMEQALRDSEEGMRQLADGAFEGIVIHEKGIILEVNQAYCRLFDAKRTEVIGKMAFEMTAPEYRGLVQQKIATNDMQPYEIAVMRKDGSTFRVEVESRPIIYRGLPARITTIHDLTERELAESRRLELAFVNQKTEILKDFLNVVSHDLKTPLSIINISLYLLEKITDPEDQRLKLEKIKAQTQRLEKLIQDILTVSRLDTVPDIVFGSLDLNRALREIYEQFESVAEKRNIYFELQLTPGLPVMQVSITELHRALVNLVENALHYTPAQGRVSIRTLRDAEQVIIEIQDTGIGIDEGDLPHIFEHFYRADKARATDTGGTGLGLAIVKKIIEIHHGTIEIESKLGEGSTFRVRLPLTADPA